MSSIIDAFREVFGDRLAILKLTALTIPTYYSYILYVESQQRANNFMVIAVLTFLLVFGTMVEVTSNIINERTYVLPSLNPFKLVFSALKALIAMVPMVIIPYFIANFLCSMINIIPWLDVTLKSLIWLVVASVAVAGFLMYCVNEKIPEAYNFKVIYYKAGDLIVVLIFFILQFVLMNIPTTILIAYIIYVLFGYCPIFDFFVTFAIVFNILVTGHYLGQVHYETIVYNKVE